MNLLLEPAVAIYFAMAVALAVWLGIFIFLWRIDKATRELRDKLDQQAAPEEPTPHATLEQRRQDARSDAPAERLTENA